MLYYSKQDDSLLKILNIFKCTLINQSLLESDRYSFSHVPCLASFKKHISVKPKCSLTINRKQIAEFLHNYYLLVYLVWNIAQDYSCPSQTSLAIKTLLGMMLVTQQPGNIYILVHWCRIYWWSSVNFECNILIWIRNMVWVNEEWRPF